MTSFLLETVFPGATQDENSVTLPKASLATLEQLSVNSAEGIIAAIVQSARNFYTPARRDADPEVAIAAGLATTSLTFTTENSARKLLWNIPLEFFFPFPTPEFDASVFDGGNVVVGEGGGEAAPDPFGQPDFRWQQLISDALDITGRRHVWIVEPVPVLTLPEESDGDGWVIANSTDTDTAIAATDITIPAGASAYLVFSVDAWEHVLLAPPAPPPPPPPEPERLTFQSLTTASSAIAPDESRHIWITEPVTTLTLPASATGEGFFIVNATEEASEVPGENQGDPAIALPPQTTTLFVRTAQGWNHQAIGGGEAAPPAASPPIPVNIFGSDFAVSMDPDILYEFGTNFGTTAWSNPLDGVRCAVSASAYQGTPSTAQTLGDRASSYFATSGDAGDWVGFDFDPSGNGTRVILDAFAWQHVNTIFQYRLQNFVVEAGNGADLGSYFWETLVTIADTNFIRGGVNGWSTVRALTQLTSPYQFVRIRSTGPDSEGSHFILGGEVVFGGEIYRGN